jgi:hypothetical protein
MVKISRHYVRPVTLEDHRFYQIDPTSPEVISFHLMLEGREGDAFVKEWRTAEFKVLLDFLDAHLADGKIDAYGWQGHPDGTGAPILLMREFPSVDNLQHAIAIVQFWQDTYSKFHPVQQIVPDDDPA